MKSAGEIEGLIDAVAASAIHVLVEDGDVEWRRAVAIAIHQRSSRRDGPFLELRCGQMQREKGGEFLERELFGYERMAFGRHGAAQGALQRGSSGTVFIDEVEAMDLATQVALFRTMELGQLVRIGSVTAIPTDARVILGAGTTWLSVGQGLLRPELVVLCSWLDRS